ncbi:MAG: NUDIX domain-containing protein [Dehalococcoidales bacterium]|nr:NUDIX domain-containing protein [Dehalococcoidales bacterium]
MPKNIRVIAICIFRRGNSVLVCEYFDSFDKKPFYRPLGGAVEYGETTEAAIRREIREEIRQEIVDLKLMRIIENIFVHEGKPGHEIVYVYEGRFTDKSAYQQESFEVHEETEIMKASWRDLDSFNDYHRLVPGELVRLLKTNN